MLICENMSDLTNNSRMCDKYLSYKLHTQISKFYHIQNNKTSVHEKGVLKQN